MSLPELLWLSKGSEAVAAPRVQEAEIPGNVNLIWLAGSSPRVPCGLAVLPRSHINLELSHPNPLRIQHRLPVPSTARELHPCLQSPGNKTPPNKSPSEHPAALAAPRWPHPRDELFLLELPSTQLRWRSVE